MVPLGDPVEHQRGRRQLELDLHDTFDVAPCHLEAGIAEDAQHCEVLRQHLRDEPVDTFLAGMHCEALEQPAADPAPLHVVRNRERNLCARRIS
jgi:hypothetical protein